MLICCVTFGWILRYLVKRYFRYYCKGNKLRGSDSSPSPLRSNLNPNRPCGSSLICSVDSGGNYVSGLCSMMTK